MSGDEPVVGFIGFGDQGLPMAAAIADAGYDLHVWARTPSSLDGLQGHPTTAHDDVEELAAAVDVVELCVSEDEDVIDLITRMLPSLRAGSTVVNHGTGTPRNAELMARTCAERQVHVLDAPVSGGRPAAERKELTSLVGGPQEAFDRCEPVFDSFSTHVIHLGDTGSGQKAKLFNNAMLMMNQAAIADILELGTKVGLGGPALVEALKAGSATSAALTLLGTMITTETVQHLSEVEALDMHIFEQAMQEAGLDATQLTARGLSGAQRLPDVVAILNP